MARKKSVKLAARNFLTASNSIAGFTSQTAPPLSDQYQSWIYDYSVIRLYREFERLMLSALTGAINNDTTTLANRIGISFPKHLTYEVCEFLITGNGYFDFKGRDGLIKTVKEFVPEDHYLVTVVKKQAYKKALNRLSALRNFAAHESGPSKRAALVALECKNLSSSGSWLKKQKRFQELVASLQELAKEINLAAPF
ncbi:MAG: hypothetical protein ACYC46_08630 [Acidobacteriaceae bacterium]